MPIEYTCRGAGVVSELGDSFGRSRDALQQCDTTGLQQFARPRIWHDVWAPFTVLSTYGRHFKMFVRDGT